MITAVSGHGNTAHSAAQPLRLRFGLPVAIGQASMAAIPSTLLEALNNAQKEINDLCTYPRIVDPDVAVFEVHVRDFLAQKFGPVLMLRDDHTSQGMLRDLWEKIIAPRK